MKRHRVLSTILLAALLVSQSPAAQPQFRLRAQPVQEEDREALVIARQAISAPAERLRIADLGDRTVRNGDSLYLIARKFRVGIDQIARWNDIDKNKILRPGQKLTMYVDVTKQSS